MGDKDPGDDEALSSLLLLLKSNQNKERGGDGMESLDNEDGMMKVWGEMAGNSRNVPEKYFSMDELRKYFHLPIVEVARQLGICTTLLKKICRKNKINRWPYRQIRSITKSIQSLEMAMLNDAIVDTERNKYQDHIRALQHTLDLLIQDPNTPGMLDDEDIEGLVDGMDLSQLQHGGQLIMTNNSSGTGGYHSYIHKPPRAEVTQVIAAVQASAEFEWGHALNKRKADEMEKNKNDGGRSSSSSHHSGEPSPTELQLQQQSAIESANEDLAMELEAGRLQLLGATIVSCCVVTMKGVKKVSFIGSVQLAPLIRKKVRTQKKVVPLIEPDICNYVGMDFLPQTVIQHSTTRMRAASASAAAAASFADTGVQVQESSSSGNNNNTSAAAAALNSNNNNVEEQQQQQPQTMAVAGSAGGDEQSEEIIVQNI